MRINNETQIDITKDIIIPLLGIIIGIINVEGMYNTFLAILTVIIQLIVLFVLFLRGNYTDYLGFFCLSFSLCVEFNTFANMDSFINFRNLRFAGINLGVWLLIPFSLMCVLISRESFTLASKIKPLYSFSTQLITIISIAVIIGLFNLLINDNGVLNFPNTFLVFLNEFYTSFAFVLLLILTYLYLVALNKLNLSRFRRYLFAIILGVAAQILYSYYFELYGQYAGVNILMVSTVSFVAPLFPIAVFIELKNMKKAFVLFVFGILLFSTYIFLKFNSNGKIIILAFLSPVILYYTAVKSKRSNIAMLIFFIALEAILAFSLFALNRNEYSILYMSKFSQVKSLFNFGDTEWFDLMEGSPKFRIAEFYCILIEFLYKPWYFPFGKGVLGTIKDHINFFKEYAYLEGTFSVEEWDIGAFCGMHFVPASFLLWGGLFGLFFYIKTIVTNIRNIYSNFFLLIGTVWFALFFGYSTTLTVFGITSLLVGYHSSIAEETFNEPQKTENVSD